MSADFSDILTFLRRVEGAAVNVEGDIKAAAARRAAAVHAVAYERLPGPGETPYATGVTRDHLVIVEDDAHKQFRVEVSDIPGRDPRVPAYHEFGTVGSAARPFLRPAVDENRDAYFKDAEQVVEQRWRDIG